MNDALVLIVEDEEKIASVLNDYLELSAFRTHTLSSGETVCEWVREHQPDMVLLDIMLPGKDGLTICKELRQFSDVPIIMITARVDEIDRLLGLELGADDYVCKPFSAREVVARVKAILRRCATTDDDAKGVNRGLAIDESAYGASLCGHPLNLTPVEFRLLALLARQPRRVFSRDQLIEAMYTDGRIVSDRTVDSHVKNLRKKMIAASNNDDWIRSIYGVGYKLD